MGGKFSEEYSGVCPYVDYGSESIEVGGYMKVEEIPKILYLTTVLIVYSLLVSLKEIRNVCRFEHRVYRAV